MYCVLLLTGTIKPNVGESLYVSDSDVRLNQYLSAIHWYLENTDLKIVFCENNMFDLSSFFANEKRVECLTFDGLELAQNNGREMDRGYGEMLIIEYALMHSSFLRKADVIIKGTGRLILYNIKALQNIYYQRCARYPDVAAWMYKDMQRCDSRFFIATRQWVLSFCETKNRVSNFFDFESNLALFIKETIRNSGDFYYPILAYRIKGICGGLGHVYDASFIRYVIRCFHNYFIRIIVLWEIQKQNRC